MEEAERLWEPGETPRPVWGLGQAGKLLGEGSELCLPGLREGGTLQKEETAREPCESGWRRKGKWKALCGVPVFTPQIQALYLTTSDWWAFPTNTPLFRAEETKGKHGGWPPCG